LQPSGCNPIATAILAEEAEVRAVTPETAAHSLAIGAPAEPTSGGRRNAGGPPRCPRAWNSCGLAASASQSKYKGVSMPTPRKRPAAKAATRKAPARKASAAKASARKTSSARSSAKRSARPKASRAARAGGELNGRAINRVKKALESTQKELKGISGGLGKDVAKRLKDAGRDVEKINKTVVRDLERLQKELGAATKAKPARKAKPKAAAKAKKPARKKTKRTAKSTARRKARAT
jgi:hypothetical protein